MATFSQTLVKQATKLGGTVQYMIMADLMAVGYSEADAYMIAYPENAALSVQQNKSLRESITRSGKFKRVYDARHTLIRAGVLTPSNNDDIELVGTEEVLKEILKAAMAQPTGSKERADLYAKYNDIRQVSSQVVDEVTDNIQFVLPLKCRQCPLFESYNEALKERGEKEMTSDEMMRVLSNIKLKK